MSYEEISANQDLSNQDKRRLRIQLARQKGTHTQQEWIDMKVFFRYTCASCLDGDSIVKDHIIPIYQGGSDSIANIQPLCMRCNSSKGPNGTDYRPRLANFLGKELPKSYTNPF